MILNTLLEKGHKELMKSDEGSGASTGEVHKLAYQGETFVLREVHKKENERTYQETYNAIQEFGFFPELISKRKGKFLFKYIPGRDLRKNDDPELIFQIGRMSSQVNSTLVTSHPNQKIRENIKYLNDQRIISFDQAVYLERLFSKLEDDCSPQYSLELYDIIHSNFRVHQKKVYLVDIDSIKPALKGIGIAKGYLKWFNLEQRKAFEEGYKSNSPMDFFTKDYRDFTYLNYLVFSIAKFNRNNKPYKNNRALLERFIHGEEI